MVDQMFMDESGHTTRSIRTTGSGQNLYRCKGKSNELELFQKT